MAITTFYRCATLAAQNHHTQLARALDAGLVHHRDGFQGLWYAVTQVTPPHGPPVELLIGETYHPSGRNTKSQVDSQYPRINPTIRRAAERLRQQRSRFRSALGLSDCATVSIETIIAEALDASLAQYSAVLDA